MSKPNLINCLNVNTKNLNMRKLLLLLVCLSSVLVSHAQIFRAISVSGQLISNNPATPLGNITINMTDSSANSGGGIISTTLTNNAGFFYDSLMIRGSQGVVYIWLSDCNNTMITQMMPYNPGTSSLSFVINYCASSTSGCVASFTQITNGQQVTFTGNIPVPGLAYTYNWSFGNGNTGTGRTVTQNFNPGTYNVCLYLTGPNGCNDTVCQTVTVGASTYPVNGAITGPVSSQNNIVEVILYQLPNWIGLDTVLAYPDSMSGGYVYYFNPVLSGQYAVLAQLAPNSSQYSLFLPTYYGNSGAWQTSTPITVGPNSPMPPYNISMISMPIMPAGPGNIGGTILRGNWRVTNGVLQNVRVQLRDNNGLLVRNSFTNANGTFNFSNLPLGNYTVLVDWGGRTMTPYGVSLTTAQNSVNNIFVTVNQGSITTGVNNEVQLNSLVYPNPVQNELNLALQATEAGTWNIEVLDMSGRIISRQTQDVTSGSNLITIDATNWSRGLYLLQGSNNQGIKITYKLVK